MTYVIRNDDGSIKLNKHGNPDVFTSKGLAQISKFVMTEIDGKSRQVRTLPRLPHDPSFKL